MFLRITTVDEKLFPSPVSGRGRGEKIGRAGLLASHRPGYAVASSSSAAGALSTKLPISAHLLAVTRMVTDPGIIWSERALLKWFHLLSSRNEFFLFLTVAAGLPSFFIKTTRESLFEIAGPT